MVLYQRMVDRRRGLVLVGRASSSCLCERGRIVGHETRTATGPMPFHYKRILEADSRATCMPLGPTDEAKSKNKLYCKIRIGKSGSRAPVSSGHARIRSLS